MGDKDIYQKKQEALNLFIKRLFENGVKDKIARIILFGSVAEEKATEDSDIDILIDLDKNLSLLKLIELKIKLEKILKKKVDLIEYDLIHPLIKKDAFKEEVKILWGVICFIYTIFWKA